MNGTRVRTGGLLAIALASGTVLLGQEGIDYLTSIGSAGEFERISVLGSGPGERITKYLAPASEDPSLLPIIFQNVRRHPLHQEFLPRVFPRRFGDLDTRRYLDLVARRATRRYFAGSIIRGPTESGTVHGFTIFTERTSEEELPSAEEVRRVYEKLNAAFVPPEIAYAPDTPKARSRAREWRDPGFPVLLDGQTEAAYEAYTRGVGYGTLRLLTLEEFDDANRRGLLSWQDIVVVDAVPSDIDTVIAGLLTEAPQSTLSHVAVRTARRGTPNAFLRDARAELAPFAGTLVRLEIESNRYRIAPAVLAEAETHWAASRPRVLTAPEVDLSESGLPELEEMHLAGEPLPPEARYGGKATQLARLQRVLDGRFERYREQGFVIPAAYYVEFLRGNHITSILDPSRSVTYEEFISELGRSESFRTDTALRFATLAKLREHMREESTIPPGLQTMIAARIAEVFGSTTRAVRFRSSSNVEDLLEFNGAGLYDSTTACAADEFDGDGRGPSRCDATKRSERDIARALRKVWASLWNFRAHEERAWFRIPQENAAMAILVTRAFLDERAGAVAFTGNPSNVLDPRHLVIAQAGEESVVSPAPDVLPERNALHVDSAGEVVRIERLRPSSLLPDGRVLPDAVLEEIGRVLFHIERSFPVDAEGHPPEQVLLDVELKLEADGELALKQIRPFLVGTPPPDGPTFVLEVPAELTLCGNFAVGRDPVSEHRLKSQLTVVPGRHELPSVVDSFQAELIEEVIFAEERVRLEPAGSGFFQRAAAASGDGDVTHTYRFEQDFTLPGGGVFAVSLEHLEFHESSNGADPEVRTLDDPFSNSGLILRGIPDGDRSRIVLYSSCSHSTLPGWSVRADLEDGARLRLEERSLARLTGTGPAALVSARVTIGETSIETSDYWRLTYSALHHNRDARYLIALEPPLNVPRTGAVHAIEVAEPLVTPAVSARAIYRGEDLEVVARPRVITYVKCLPPACPGGFRRGDVDSSGRVSLTDAVRLLDFVARDGSAPACLDAADFDDNGAVEITDAVLILAFLFQGVDFSRPPGPLECGFDGTPDGLGELCRDPSCPGV